MVSNEQPTILISIPPKSFSEKYSSTTTVMWCVNTQRKAKNKKPSHRMVAMDGTQERSSCNSLGINIFR